jgi:hypothetical protein
MNCPAIDRSRAPWLTANARLTVADPGHRDCATVLIALRRSINNIAGLRDTRR